MDDVDCLFECFKIGISPPKSDSRQKKRIKQSKDVTRRLEVSPRSNIQSSASTEKSPQSDLQLIEPNFVTPPVKRNNFCVGKRVSPLVFYGSPRGVLPKKPTSLLRLLHEIRIDIAEQKKLRCLDEVWATFPRQEEAMKYAKEHADVHVFSYQDHVHGTRRFLVSTYKEFWRRYKNMNPKFRHHYEVIQEGQPCHLYFDLEFSRKENEEKNGEEMVDLLLLVVFDALNEKYSIQGNYDWIVELDSSTKDKFSRHIIIRLPKAAFKDNTHAGAFVAEICSRIYIGRESDKRYENLFISKESSSCNDIPTQIFVDTAVYSRNRCFRLALSSKAGKTSLLLPTERFKCKNMSEGEMFMASLICNMDRDCEKLLICKMDATCVKALHFDTELQLKINSSYNGWPNMAKEFEFNGFTNEGSRSFLMGKSPFPVLDMFVEHVASTGNKSGKIWSWYWFSEYGLMVYSMSRNRYCERIGREHKSNKVIYVVDLKRVVYYQKCHDPDCRGYRSPFRPIPANIIPEFPNNSRGEEDQIDDEWWNEAVNVANKIENISQPTTDQFQQHTEALEEDLEEDVEWLMEVERKTCETELMYSLQSCKSNLLGHCGVFILLQKLECFGATTDNLKRRNCNATGACPICASEPETPEHLLFRCTLAKNWSGLTATEDHVSASSLVKIWSKYAVIGWNIWIAQNQKVFNNILKPICYIRSMAIDMWMKSCPSPLDGTCNPSPLAFSLPAQGVVAMTDAAFDIVTGKTAIAAVICKDGLLFDRFAVRFRTNSAVLAEALAVRMCLKKFQAFNIGAAWIVSRAHWVAKSAERDNLPFDRISFPPVGSKIDMLVMFPLSSQ